MISRIRTLNPILQSGDVVANGGSWAHTIEYASEEHDVVALTFTVSGIDDVEHRTSTWSNYIKSIDHDGYMPYRVIIRDDEHVEYVEPDPSDLFVVGSTLTPREGLGTWHRTFVGRSSDKHEELLFTIDPSPDADQPIIVPVTDTLINERVLAGDWIADHDV